jgi:hypothetical protein
VGVAQGKGAMVLEKPGLKYEAGVRVGAGVSSVAPPGAEAGIVLW